jgi:hypothetical protein
VPQWSLASANRKHQHSTTCFSVIFDKKNGSPFDPAVEFYCDDNGYAYSTAIKVPGVRTPPLRQNFQNQRVNLKSAILFEALHKAQKSRGVVKV